MKSGPSPSTITLGAKPSVIEPPLPKVATSSEPLLRPPPLGGPSTMSGSAACPVVGPGPAMNDSTDVANRDGQVSPSLVTPAAPASAMLLPSDTDDPHAAHANQTKAKNGALSA